MPKPLVIYFSRSGRTRRVAEAIAGALDADIEALLEPRSRRGLRGYLRSSAESLTERTSELLPIESELGEYPLVVIGGPVWNHSVSTPVRTFLVESRMELRRVAFFVTEGSSGEERVFRQMEQLSGLKPDAELALHASEVDHGLYFLRVKRFADRLAPPGLRPVPPEPPAPQPFA